MKKKTGNSPEAPLLNRELSWLAFNERVLELAAESELPLLERVRYASIFSSNLDEFFMVRVAGLMRQESSELPMTSPDGRTPRQALQEIREHVIELMGRQLKLWTSELQPALEAAGIKTVTVAECSRDELSELEGLFEREIYPVLTPLAVGPGQPFPYISGLSVSLAVRVKDPRSGEERFARVKVPEGFPRFLPVGVGGPYVRLEDVIGHFLGSLFPGMDVAEQAVFRVTRDEDFEVSDEADDLLEAVEGELRRRRFGDVVRLEVSDHISEGMLEWLAAGVGAYAYQFYLVGGPLDLADLAQLADLDRPELRYPSWVPITMSRIKTSQSPHGLFAEIGKSDILVHLPYDSFASSVEAFVRGASKDPSAIALKATVYRTSEESPLVPALVEAAEEGKESVCLVELKARFDERRNIEWSRHLERAGVHVVYGFPNLKIHAKAILIVRREGSVLRRYAHLGTGNYHSATARIYEDFGLFTADPDIAADVAELFNYLTGFGRPRRFRKLLVAPFTLRTRLVEEIRKVADSTSKKGRILLKVNALTDPQLIEELYRASQKGVTVEIIARSVCTLRPGVPGVSDNITVRSILGRFLEHSRIFIFESGRRTSCFLGSADLMPRNLDHRVEMVFPVEDPKSQQDLMAAFDMWLKDRMLAWELDSSGHWKRLQPTGEDRRVSSQDLMMRKAKARTGRQLPAKRRS